jgi:hypothetical protein
MDSDRAEAMANRWTENVLRPGVPIVFEDPEIGVKYVWEILGDPERYDGENCYDPIEGEDYGRPNAKFFANQLCVNCFAHGGGIFFLRHDMETVKELLERGDPGKAVEILCNLAPIMDVTPVEQKILVKLAGERNTCGEKVASASLKEALGAERARRAEAERERLDRESTTIRLPAEFPDCKINPVMAEWDDILANAEAFEDDTEPFSEPPMRDVEGRPVRVRWRDSVGLHALTSAGANAEGEDEKSILPAPDQYLLSKHDKFSLEREVGNYITFFERTQSGARDVAPPEKHVLHYLGFNDSKAPRVHAVLTLPIVTQEGTVVAENGLNRELKSVLRIDKTLLRWIPKKEDCTPQAVRAAYKFLTEEWFVDVLTDRRGKAILVAFALSIIERCLISNRPIFTVTAGQRGGGKTTILMMIILAVLGVMPSAAAWSMDPNERKKALFAYLLEGLPALVWDNIPRGSVISCPSIERSCTAKGYSDRILGETGIGQADAYTIQTLTGNCIRCKGDLASRNLTVLITTERPDPENREFKHRDPMSWTNDHRGKILHALYTILLAKNNEQTTEGTRFKEWQWLVGSQVEFAANGPEVPAEQRISFKEIFLEGERESDDDAMDYADVLGVLFSLFPPPDSAPTDPKATLIRGREFDVMSVLKRVGGSDNKHLQSEDGTSLPEEILNLRLWLTYPGANGPTIRSIPKLLKSIDGTPVLVGGGIMSLHWQQDTHKKKPVFWIEFRPELNPDGSKTNQAERVELGLGNTEPEQHDAHVKANEQMKNPPSSRAGPCQGRGATPDYLAHAPISGNPFQVLEEFAARQSGEVKKDKGKQP